MDSADDDGHASSRDPQSHPDVSEGRQSSSTERRSEGRSSAWARALRDIAPYLDLGWRLAATTAGPPVLGLVVDLWLDTTPWLLLGGCAFGLTGAVLQLKRLQGEKQS